jgi:hypothetical protein
MGQQQAQTCNNITPNTTLVATFPNENNLHTVPTSRPFALNGRSEGSEHNLEVPDETEYSDLLHPTVGKQRMFSLSF